MGSRSLTAIRKLRGWVRDDGRKSEERSLGFARDDKALKPLQVLTKKEEGKGRKKKEKAERSLDFARDDKARLLRSESHG